MAEAVSRAIRWIRQLVGQTPGRRAPAAAGGIRHAAWCLPVRLQRVRALSAACAYSSEARQQYQASTDR